MRESFVYLNNKTGYRNYNSCLKLIFYVKKLDSGNLVKVGGAFDAMSAKIVETHRFDAIWAGSFAISATHALPDASIMTMTEFLNVTASMEPI